MDEITKKKIQEDCDDLKSEPYGRYRFDLPKEAEPELIGLLAAKRFEMKLKKVDTHYKTACTWYGALQLAGLLDEASLLESIIKKFRMYMRGAFNSTLMGPGHVDQNVFGIVPFEIYRKTKDKNILSVGKALADHQLKNKDHPDQRRYAVDDMFMLIALQVQAYRATTDEKYLNFAASRMVEYLNRLQKSDGFFYHLTDNDIKWGRGNGWFASGMTEILQELDESHAHYATIRKGYLKMMAGLLQYQIQEGRPGAGLWHQVIDNESEENWPESSGSAMFAFAMVTGIDKGWLDCDIYGPVARRTWLALVNLVDETGDLRDISDWCYFPTLKEYLDRGRLTGDGHGQAPLLWTAAALIRNKQKQLV